MDSVSGIKYLIDEEQHPPVVNLSLLRRFDPLAVSPLTKDRYFYYSFKRALDVTVALFVLLLLAPIMILIAALIVVDSGWPIIFTQERVGAQRWVREGFSYWQRSPFSFYKFRTMVRDANPALHQAFVTALINHDSQGMAEMQGENHQVCKLVGDPRITRIGKFLRRSSLDEVPQLWNVLKGDMSLVGPRPPIQYEVDAYKPSHHRRLEIKPGLTGLWQVTARSSADFDEIVRLDIEYIDNQSIWLDLKILIRTPRSISWQRGYLVFRQQSILSILSL